MPGPNNGHGQASELGEDGRAELAHRLGIDVAALTEADADWFADELRWIEHARGLLDAALAEAGDPGWRLGPGPGIRGT